MRAGSRGGAEKHDQNVNIFLGGKKLGRYGNQILFGTLLMIRVGKIKGYI